MSKVDVQIKAAIEAERKRVPAKIIQRLMATAVESLEAGEIDPKVLDEICEISQQAGIKV